jgi:hypothetical protein
LEDERLEDEFERSSPPSLPSAAPEVSAEPDQWYNDPTSAAVDDSAEWQAFEAPAAFRNDWNEENEEFAAEFAPTPLLGNQLPNRVEKADFETEEDDTSSRGGQTFGWIGLVLAIASLFIYPVAMGFAAVIMGLVAFVQGSRALGSWSVIIGGIALLAYYVIVPYYT